jgi:hypothetical protein
LGNELAQTAGREPTTAHRHGLSVIDISSQKNNGVIAERRFLIAICDHQRINFTGKVIII